MEPSTAVTLTDLDAHDGTVTQDPATGDLYLYGTRYGCGFQWRSASPWCGYGAWKSADGIEGPWEFQRLLFEPTAYNWYRSTTWQAVCGDTGVGCFNPRMVRRGDGVWILAFNAPSDFSDRGANAYYFMGCAGPAGPCGPGATNGSLTKPKLWGCTGNGDFSLFDNGAGTAYMVCTMNGAKSMTLSIEQLDKWWTNGVQGVNSTLVAGVKEVEGPGVIKVGSAYFLTFGTPYCGYCASGTGMGWANSPLGAYARQPDLADAAVTGGQPRSVFSVDGQAYLWVDEWVHRQPNQADANVRLVPLKVTDPKVEPNW